MSRYQVQRYVYCDKKELDNEIDFWLRNEYNIEIRPNIDGNFIVATKYDYEIYIGFEEFEKKEVNQD